MTDSMIALLKSNNPEDNVLGIILATEEDFSEIFNQIQSDYSIYLATSFINSELDRRVIIINKRLIWCNGIYAIVKPEHYDHFYTEEIIYTDNSIKLNHKI